MERETLRVLIVEDNPGDADLICEKLSQRLVGPDRQPSYDVSTATHVGRAVQLMEATPFDVVLLDLELPDSWGLASVETVRRECGSASILVLTGTENEQLALSCISAGAQDYINKNDLSSRSLHRSIGYALSRQREARVRELEAMLEQYRNLSAERDTSSKVPATRGNGSLRLQLGEEFSAVVYRYRDLISGYLDHLVTKRPKPHEVMQELANELGRYGSGPKDLLDVHLAALEVEVEGVNESRSSALAVEGRLLALEMMGLLVDYYRIGGRRTASKGTGT